MDFIKQVIHQVFASIRLIGSFIKKLLVGLFRWFIGVLSALFVFWQSLGPKWLRVTFFVGGVMVVGYIAAKGFVKPKLTQENIYQVHYLNEGWTDEQRETFYYTPQGTELLGLEYDWFVNLELPLSHELMMTEENMRGWGFVVDPAQRPSIRNPGNLPVGLGRHTDPSTGRQKLDIGCATCHTGELHYKGVALRVDGGQSMQSIATAKRGEFITTLGAAVFETLLNPAKWSRFATRVVGHEQTPRDMLKNDVWVFAKTLKSFVSSAGASKYYPVEEGRGRTDAVGRIANIVFGYDLDEPDNYRVADAPASYPFIWDIWRFDWVQYTGFTNQAMARNVGESLGVLAPIKLVDDQGKLLPPEEFGETVIDIDGMHCVEGLLRDLKPPKWPEEIFGKVDLDKAKRGKALFADQCAACHGPHISEPYSWEVAETDDQNPANQIDVNSKWDMAGEITYRDGKAFRNDWRERIWSMPWLATDVIGTDPTLADNYVDTKYSATKLVPGSDPVNAGDGLQVLLNRLMPQLYEKWDISGDKVANFDGLNVPFRIENQRAYKSRPLHGVWATPPFLHNGSVPTIYDLLSPLRARPEIFYSGNREYDPKKLGYAAEDPIGAFKHDTTIKGNWNTGHLFTDVQMPGRIGDLLSEQQRMDIIEYVKVMGNPDFSEGLDGDPLNWDKYSRPPVDNELALACKRSHALHVENQLFNGQDLSKGKGEL
jgi:mono/diheme cytochrome c family protein